MHNTAVPETRSRIAFIILLMLTLSSIAVAPAFFSTEARVVKGKGFVEQTKSHDESLPNYDIRTDKASYKKLASFRDRSGKSAAAVADLRDGFVEGERSLSQRVDNLQVIYGPHSRTPEIIGTDVIQGKHALAPLSGSRADTVRQFIAQNDTLFGIRADQALRLKVLADYENPEGGMSFVRLEQTIDGVKVFGGEVRAGFGKDGELVRVINNLAAGATEGASDAFGDPASAYELAVNDLGNRAELKRLDAGGFTKDGPYKFGEGDFAPVAEKVYFPTEPGVIVPAWLVLIWQPVNAFYHVVDVESGSVLWRKNISEDQTQPASYNIWANPNAMINVADSPFPRTPGPNSPDGSQAPALARTLVTLIGNEAPYTFNTNGWLTDGANSTDGNAVEAGLDRDGSGIQASNGVDANGIAAGNPFRVFDFPINPGVPVPNGDPPAGDHPLQPGVNPTPCFPAGTSPAMVDFQRAAVTTLFYITNRYHDEMYRLGFNEQAGNFQHDNFGRGGVGGDRISGEAQDCSGTNNANFGTPADGQRGRMQMYIWINNVPYFDGDLDADVMIHELTHGLSNRLHGNAFGLSSNMSRGMGEGWSDFYAHVMLSEPNDDPAGIYTTGAYDTYRHRGPTNFYNNYYYGIRRFPKAILSSLGGPNSRPHNPLTFADIDSTQANVSDGAFAAAFAATPDQVHAAGEVWSSMLWEVRAKYIARLGWEVGNRRVLQHVTDGMKLSPLNPTFVDSRNGIIAAALADGTAEDVKDVWDGFALRGMGASAQVTNTGSGGGGTARVIQAFDLPNLQQPGITVSDSTGDNDGFPEPGEQVRISIPLKNETGNLATNVSATLVGSGTLSYGSIAHNGTASNDFNYTVPADAGCGSVVDLTINVDSSLGPVSFSRTIRIGVPQTTSSQNFDGVTAPALPDGWTAAPVSGGTNFVNSTLDPDSAPNSMYALEPETVGGGTDLTSPSIPIVATAATLSFRHRYNTEAGWDGGLVEIRIGGGAFQDLIAAGGSFVENGYNGQLGVNVAGNSPLGGRNAWSGDSGGYVTTRVLLPPSAAGQDIQLRWRFGADDNTVAPGANPGWFIDSIEVVGNYACSFSPSGVRSDFDGDGRSDFALFRPLEGNWYVLPAHANGYFGFSWGLNGDIPAPADYDNDGKTDAGLYRPGQGGADGIFYVLKSSDLTYSAAQWGLQGDIPVVRDYDGDGLPDFAVYRPSEQNWYVLEADGGFTGVNFGQPGDVPVAGDFDGDGIGDMTVYRSGQWITRFSSGGTGEISWGLGTDMPVPADYDGDGKDDYAVFRPSEGTWWIIRSSDLGYSFFQWGLNGDVPVPGDYDGDGKYDPAIFRNGEWWATFSTGGHGAVQFGSPGDIPAGKGYIP